MKRLNELNILVKTNYFPSNFYRTSSFKKSKVEMQKFVLIYRDKFNALSFHINVYGKVYSNKVQI